MTARHLTRDAVLAYIRADSEPCYRAAIMRYLFHAYSVTPAATRQQLHRLCREGVIEQVDGDWYKAKAEAV